MKFKYQDVYIWNILYVLQVTHVMLNSKLCKKNRLCYFVMYSKDDFLNSESITEGANWFWDLTYLLQGADSFLRS